MSLSVKLHAGVGNRLFQYASIKGFAKKQNCDFYIGEEIYDFEHKTLHEWFLKCISHEQRKKCLNLYLQPVDFHINKSEEFIPINSHCEGYFQSEDNFYHIKDEINKIIRESPEIKSELDDFGNWDKIACIHVRLGDFLYQRHHFVDLTNYYNHCISLIPEEYRIIIICEQDIDEIKKVYSNVSFPKKCEKYKKDEEFDMFAMSRSSIVICSNSTFAWWGAWLGNNKTVYIPDKWFAYNDKIVPMKGSKIIKCNANIS